MGKFVSCNFVDKGIRILLSALFVFNWMLLLSLFSTKKISIEENRYLASYPQFTKKQQLNFNFGQQLEYYLKDHFPFRYEIIQWQMKTLYALNGRIENDAAFLGEDGWMFLKKETLYRGSSEKIREEIADMADIVKRLYGELKNRNNELFVILLPDKNDMYREKWLAAWKDRYVPYTYFNRNDEFIKLLKDEPDIHVINLEDIMTAAGQNGDIYSKEGVHMSKIGVDAFLSEMYRIISNRYFPNRQIKYEYRTDGQLDEVIAYYLSFSRRFANFSQGLEVDIKEPQIDYNRLNYEKDNVLIYEEGTAEPALVDKHAYFLGFCYVVNELFPLFKYFFKKTTRYQLVGLAYSRKHLFLRQLRRLIGMVKYAENSVLFLGLDVNDLELYDYLKTVMKEL